MAALPKVGSLTDDELRANLIQLGYRDCGPITGTTRGTYEKKLLQLCQAGGIVVGPPAAASGTPSKPNASNAASASANGIQTPTCPTNGASSTRSSSAPSKPRPQQPPPNAAHLESLDETGSEDDQPAPSHASARRNLDQRSRSNDQAFRAPAPVPVADPHTLSDHLEQPSESETDLEEFVSPHAPLPPQASTVPKKRGPAEQAASPRAVPPLEPSLMSTPIAATSGAGAGAGAYSGEANVPASPFMSLPSQASSGAYGFGAGVGSMAGRFPRAVSKAKPPSPTAASASTATVPRAPGLFGRLLRCLWRQVRKHTFFTLSVALIAIFVVGIWSAPASPGLGVEWCPFGYSGKDCQEKRAEVMQLYQRVLPLLQDAELEYESGRAKTLTLTKDDLLQKIPGIETELWEAFFQASKASNWFVWSVAATNLPATTAKKSDGWSRVLSLQLAPEQRRTPLSLYVHCAVEHLKYAYETSSEVLVSYWQLFLIVGVSIVLIYGVYKIKLAMKKKKEARLAAQIKKAIGLLKAQAEASNRNPQIPPYLLKSELRDKVLQGSKANKYFIHDLNLALDEMVVQNSTQIVRKVLNVNGQLSVDCFQWVGPLGDSGSKLASSTMNAAGQPARVNSPCLKIYHMFNISDVAADPSLDDRIRKGVMAKCEGLTVLHLELDVDNPKGQVYVKLASPAEAETLMTRIQGLYFQGRSIEVRQVDEAHYAQRFPVAP